MRKESGSKLLNISPQRTSLELCHLKPFHFVTPGPTPVQWDVPSFPTVKEGDLFADRTSKEFGLIVNIESTNLVKVKWYRQALDPLLFTESRVGLSSTATLSDGSLSFFKSDVCNLMDTITITEKALEDLWTTSDSATVSEVLEEEIEIEQSAPLRQTRSGRAVKRRQLSDYVYE